MKIDSIDDIKSLFPTENDARKYLHEIRWGQFANCHYCGNDRCYLIENGARYKCANPKCYRRFRITVGTMFEASNFSYQEIISALYVFASRRGRQTELDFARELKITPKTSFFLKEKLNFAISGVEKVGKSTEELMGLVFKNCCSKYEDWKEIKKSKYYNNPCHIPLDAINDISNSSQYNLLLRYTNYFINVWGRKKRPIYWLDFASPEDIVSETFLWMRDKNIKEYNTETMLRYVRNTASRMWYKFLTEHPKYNEYVKEWRRQNKKEKVAAMPTSYVIDLIMSEKNNSLTREEIKKMPNRINSKRSSVLTTRKRKKSTTELLRYNGAKFDSNIISLARIALGVKKVKTVKQSYVSKKYWDECCEVVGNNYNLNQSVIDSAKAKINDFLLRKRWLI